VFTPRSARV